MKRFKHPHALVPLLLALVAAAVPDQPGPSAPRPSTESLAAWQWFQEVRLPAWQDPPPWLDFVLPPSVFDKVRGDLGDLRLYDGKDREVPYALRVRRARDEQVQLAAREFNRSTAPDRSAELSLDLGEMAPEHNEVAVSVQGVNFRRRLRLDGSNDGKTWSAVKPDHEFLLHFQVDGQVVDVSRFRYASSRYRYVRVRVFPDASLADDKPEITGVRVLRTVRVPGEEVTRPAHLGERQPERGDGGPGSAWMIDFGGEAPPCQRLTFDIADGEFQRPYRLEVPGTEDEGAVLPSNRTAASGTWERRPADRPKPLEIELASEETVRRLRLVVTDHSNPPLTITAVTYTAPVRQMIFAPTADLAPPLRLYFGQPTASRPQYDFEALLPANLEPAPLRASLGPLQSNPVYQPPPRPLTERWPWLVYVVLGAASLVLLAILLGLAREVLARHDQGAGHPGEPQGSRL